MSQYQKLENRIGRYAALRHMRNLGIHFVDAYVAVFGRMPKKI